MKHQPIRLAGRTADEEAQRERATDVRGGQGGPGHEDLAEISMHDDSGVPAARPVGEPAALRMVARTLSLVAGLGIVAMMIVTVIDVTRRKADAGSIAGALEATEVALVAVVFASMMSAESSGAHVRTAILTSRLRPRAATIVRLVGFVIVIFFLVWVTYWTWDAAMESMDKGERRFGGNEVPVWPSKFFIPIGFGGMALEYIAHATAAVRSLRAGYTVSAPQAVEPGSLL